MTIPCAALVGAGMHGLSRVPGGAAIVFCVGVVVAATAFLARNRRTRQLEPEPTAG